MPIEPQYDRTVSLGMERLHIELKKAIRRFALYRYFTAREEYAKLVDDIQDQNYQPDSETSPEP